MLAANSLCLQVIDFIGSNFRCSSNPALGPEVVQSSKTGYESRKLALHRVLLSSLSEIIGCWYLHYDEAHHLIPNLRAVIPCA